MKTIFTLLTSMVMSVAVMAAPSDKGVKPSSMLMIRSADRGNIRVVIDGRRFEPNRNYMRLNGIMSGYHQVKIYREKSTGIFNIFGSRYEVVFNSSVSLKPRSAVTIMIDRFGRTSINESRVNTGWNYGNGRDDRSLGGRDDRNLGSRDGDNRFNDDSDNGNLDWNKDNDFDFDHDGKQGDYDGRDFGGHDNNTGGHEYGQGYNRAISDMDFSNVMQAIQKEWFDNNKAKSAAQIISTNYFTTSQVKQLLQLFTFESNKLDLAKQAYGKTVDQKNYFLINEVFSFNSSKDELARYIRSFH